MRLAGIVLALACCMAGCNSTVVLRSRTETPPPPPPAPAPAPCHDCRWVNRDEAVAIVHRAARRHDIVRLHVKEIERKKHDWRIEGRGLDTCGHRVEVRARVNRRTGVIEKFEARSEEHRRHRTRHDDD